MIAAYVVEQDFRCKVNLTRQTKSRNSGAFASVSASTKDF